MDEKTKSYLEAIAGLIMGAILFWLLFFPPKEFPEEARYAIAIMAFAVFAFGTILSKKDVGENFLKKLVPFSEKHGFILSKDARANLLWAWAPFSSGLRRYPLLKGNADGAQVKFILEQQNNDVLELSQNWQGQSLIFERPVNYSGEFLVLGKHSGLVKSQNKPPENVMAFLSEFLAEPGLQEISCKNGTLQLKFWVAFVSLSNELENSLETMLSEGMKLASRLESLR